MIRSTFQLLGDAGQVVLEVGQLDVRLQLGAPVDEVVAPAQQIPGGAHLLGVDMGQRIDPSTDQFGDLLGIDLIGLGFAAMNRHHVDGMSKNKRDSFHLTEISQPMPGEDALDTHHDVFPIGCDQFQEPIRLCRNILMEEDLPLIVQDADVHHFGMQVDSAVVLVRSVVNSHLTFLLCVVVTLD